VKTSRIIAALATCIAVLGLSSTASAYNFIYSCGAAWPSLPVTYYVNQNGSVSVGDSQLLSVIESSFNRWAAPCCSSYRAQYGGRTPQVATNTRDVVLSFEANQWDPQFGSVNSTIGVTLVQVRNDCTIFNAPILFNEVGFRFRTDGRATDLESIAVHEVGHHVGLGHETQFQGALPTMYPAYDGSTGFRTLESDDINGVCALYPGGSCACSQDRDCVGDFVCIQGTCQEAPCVSDADCPDGQVCEAGGDCVPQTCSTDNDCQNGYACTSGICERCSVCDRCNSNNDCGSNSVCVQGGVCVTYCGQDGSCPGTTVCVDGGGAFVCVNADYQTNGFCPAGFTCTDGTRTDQCAFNADCPPGQRCEEVDGFNACVPDDDPCFRVFCEAGSVCVSGQCVDDGTGGNNNTGNNSTTGNGNTGSSNNTANNNVGGTNNNTGGIDDGGVVIIDSGNTAKASDDGCSTAGGNGTPIALLLLLGLFVRRRRER
jgi:MYXO-CTERM domain-containing protein